MTARPCMHHSKLHNLTLVLQPGEGTDHHMVSLWARSAEQLFEYKDWHMIINFVMVNQPIQCYKQIQLVCMHAYYML